MVYECAPMEGVTGDLFRQAQRLHFDKADRYYTPFLSPTASRTLAARELREVEPSHNAGLYVVPQLMGHNPTDFNWMAGALRDLGYDEVNLNLGCPSGTVVTKKKGAGLLADLDLLARMLDGVFDVCPLPVSIKTRLGMARPEEFAPLLALYNQYPVKELIIHARVGAEQYRGTPHWETFTLAVSQSRAPVCYNGDLFDAAAVRRFSQAFPTVERVMLGRGLAANPGLITELKTGAAPTADALRDFHDTLYRLTAARIPDKKALLYRMKEAWRYLGCSFADSEKQQKQLRRARTPEEYEAAVRSLFTQCPVREHPGFLN